MRARIPGRAALVAVAAVAALALQSAAADSPAARMPSVKPTHLIRLSTLVGILRGFVRQKHQRQRRNKLSIIGYQSTSISVALNTRFSICSILGFSPEP